MTPAARRLAFSSGIVTDMIRCGSVSSSNSSCTMLRNNFDDLNIQFAIGFAPSLVRTARIARERGRRHWRPSPNFRSQRATNSAQVSGLGLRAISCFIRQPLADRALKREPSALGIVNAKALAGVLPEIKLGQIAVKVLGIDALINADQAAFHDAEKNPSSVFVCTSPRVHSNFEWSTLSWLATGGRA